MSKHKQNVMFLVYFHSLLVQVHYQQSDEVKCQKYVFKGRINKLVQELHLLCQLCNMQISTSNEEKSICIQRSLNRLFLADFMDLWVLETNLDGIQAKVTKCTSKDMPSCMVQPQIIVLFFQTSNEKVATYNQYYCCYQHIFSFIQNVSSFPMVKMKKYPNCQIADQRSNGISKIPRIFFLYDNSGKNCAQFQEQGISTNSSTQMKDNNFKRRNGENVIYSLPLPFAKKDFSFVYLTCVKHERRKKSHSEKHSLEFGLCLFEAAQDYGKRKEA